MATRTVTGTVHDIGGAPLEGKRVEINLLQLGLATDLPVYPQQSNPAPILTDALGEFSVDLWVNDDSEVKSLYEVVFHDDTRRQFKIPSGGGSINISDLIINYGPESAPQDSIALSLKADRDAGNLTVGEEADWRLKLGLVIGTDVQAHSVILDSTTASFLVADESKLDNIEPLADVTDTVNVTAAGALMDSELASVSAVKATTGTFLTADQTKLDGIEALADVTDATNVVAAGGYIAGGTDVAIADGGTGASTAAVARDNLGLTIQTTVSDTDTEVTSGGAVADYAQPKLQSTILVTQASDLAGTLDSTKVYYIDGAIDMGSQTIEVPAAGLSIIGATFDVSQLTSSENTYDMFTSPVGGSGNLVLKDVGITTSGTSSSVFALTCEATGLSAIEIKVVNFNNCTSLGYLDGYRQGLESGTGRFGGTPELEFRNTWIGGYRTETTIARGMSNFTSLFKAGTGFSYAGRVILGMNCDLPVTGAFCDFSASNIGNDESLQLSDCRMTRAGILDASDATIYPNIDHTNVKCLWSDNAGLPNTTKYIKANVTAEVETTISLIDTYYPLAGTFTIETSSHMDMPSNGEFRLLSGNGTYQISGDFVIDGTANDVIDMRITKSADGGATWPAEITHVRRQVNSLVGGRDVAFFPLNFISTLQEDDRVRIEVENTSGTGNVTAELDSYFIVTAL